MPERHWKQLHQYWLAKHIDGRVPSRRDLDPVVEIPELVKYLILLDARDGYTYRLVGSEVVQRHGLNMTGRRSGTSGKDYRAMGEWLSALDYVSRELKPRLLIARIGEDEVAQNVMLLLPLADPAGKIEMILVGSFYNEHFLPGTQIADMEAQEVAAG